MKKLLVVILFLIVFNSCIRLDNKLDVKDINLFNISLIKAISSQYGNILGYKVFNSKKTVIIVSDIHDDPIMRFHTLNFLVDLYHLFGIKDILLEGYKTTKTSESDMFNFDDNVLMKIKYKKKYNRQIFALLSKNNINAIEALRLFFEVNVFATEDSKVYDEMKNLPEIKQYIATKNNLSDDDILFIEKEYDKLSTIINTWFSGNASELDALIAYDNFEKNIQNFLKEYNNNLNEETINYLNSQKTFFNYCFKRSEIICKRVQELESKFIIIYVGRGHVKSIENYLIKNSISFISIDPFSKNEKISIIPEPKIINEIYRNEIYNKIINADLRKSG